MKYENIFNYNSLAIFTDASIHKNKDNSYYGCAGYVVVRGDRVLEQDALIIQNTTSNNSEIKAVRMGIEAAIRYKEFYQNIRLFSDSQLCIFGLRDRYTQWAERSYDGNLIGSNGKPILNQDVFIDIANQIVKNNLHIELYHQLGHIAITNPKDTYKAKQSFIKFNRLNEDVDDELINTISYFNNMVDQNTRRVLQDYVDHINAAEDYGYSIKQDAYTFRYMPNFDTRNYYKLIH